MLKLFLDSKGYLKGNSAKISSLKEYYKEFLRSSVPDLVCLYIPHYYNLLIKNLQRTCMYYIHQPTSLIK